MTQFRKKPVVIEAWQICARGETSVVPDWLVNALLEKKIEMVPTGGAVIHTLEGDMLGGVDDWIIKGVKGEFYPCKPDVFAITYEAADAALSVSQAPEQLDIEAMRGNLHATFSGGHHGNPAALEAFHHGMDTVCNVLASHQKGEGSNGILPASGVSQAPPQAPREQWLRAIVDEFKRVGACPHQGEDGGLCKECSRRVVDKLAAPPQAWQGIEPVRGVQDHICGLSGVGFMCPACEVVRANRAHEKPALSLSIQNDALAISELLDDQRRAVEARDVALLAIRNVLRERFGDDAHRVDLAGLATFIAQQLAKLSPSALPTPPESGK